MKLPFSVMVVSGMTFEEFKLQGFIYSQHSLIHLVSVENYNHMQNYPRFLTCLK